MGVLGEASFVELLDNQRINIRRRGQIKQAVSVELVRAVQFSQTLFQFVKGFRMMILAGHIGQGLRKFLTLDVIILMIRAGLSELLYGIDGRLLKRIVAHGSSRKADDGETSRQAILRGQAVQRRN